MGCQVWYGVQNRKEMPVGCKVELTSGLLSGWFWGFSAPFIGAGSSLQGTGSAPEFAAFQVSIWFGITYCGIQLGVIVSPTGTLFFFVTT